MKFNKNVRYSLIWTACLSLALLAPALTDHVRAAAADKVVKDTIKEKLKKGAKKAGKKVKKKATKEQLKKAGKKAAKDSAKKGSWRSRRYQCIRRICWRPATS